MSSDLSYRVTEVLKEWERDPAKMFDWRSKTLKLALLVLEEIILHPAGLGRAQDLARIRAIAQLQSLSISMDSMRSQIPVSCPHCDKEFTLP